MTSDQSPLDKSIYERELERLQIELCKLQRWVRHSGERAIIVFEGRDAAGKGGTIKRIVERVSPRVFRLVALPVPSDRERTQLYTQRYVAHFPAAGEITLFDRSWYNRAGVERVMGFCTPQETERFLREAPVFEEHITADGIRLIKYWFEVGHEEQRRRFQDRIDDPRKHWKLSPMDVESRRRWYAYSRARDAMLDATDTPHAPWHVVRADDKRRARLECIAHLLSQFPYQDVPFDLPEFPERDMSDAYDDVASMSNRRWIPNRY